MLNAAVDTQISGATNYPENAPTPALSQQTVKQLPPVQQQPVQQRVGYAVTRNRVAAVSGNGNGRRVTCTDAQAKCIYAICKAQGLDLVSVLADFNVADARDLHVKDASRLIDQLKAQQNGAAH